MRVLRSLTLVSAFGLLMVPAGCATQVTGAPRADPSTVPLALTQDGFGVVAGFEDAPAKIEIFTEPQCTHCGDLQRDFGDQLAYYVTVGTLQVTYRPLTFLDDEDGGYSSTVVNALFLASEAIDKSAATGSQFQRFVEELWVNQDPGGSAFSGDELRDMAVSAGIPDAVADNIAGADDAVDLVEMDGANFGYLIEIDPVDTGTPTVYDLNSSDKLDIGDAEWLDDLVQP